MATSMKHVNVVRVLLRHIHGRRCQAITTQLQRRLHINCTALGAARCRQQQTHQHNGLLDGGKLATSCRTMCTKDRAPQELYKTLYERTHPFYKIIKEKRKRFVPRFPLPVVEDPTRPQSDVLLYDDEETLKSMGKAYLAEEPVDDVYVMKHYPPQVATFTEALDRLKLQDKWDYCPDGVDHKRDVMVTFVLNGKLENKKKVGAFEGFIAFPHQFTVDNRVFCFAEGGDIQKAKKAGAYMVDGPDKMDDFVRKIIQVTKKAGVYTDDAAETVNKEGVEEFLGDVEYVDYVVATPASMRTLQPLKKLLKAKYPQAKRGSVHRNIDEAVLLFKKGTAYEGKYFKDDNDEEQFTCVTSIGKLDMTNDQLEENLKVLIDDVCTRRPLKLGPFITEVSVTASHLDIYTVQSEHYMPEPAEEEKIDTLQELEMLEKEMQKQSAL